MAFVYIRWLSYILDITDAFVYISTYNRMAFVYISTYNRWLSYILVHIIDGFRIY